MKILHLGKFDGDVGGIERQLRSLLQNLPPDIEAVNLVANERRLRDEHRLYGYRTVRAANHGSVASVAIAPSLPLAVVVAEDQGFASHRGFDLEAIERALEHNARGGRVRGGSTISQQLAKNLFLWSGRSWVRKGLEAWYTLLIEALWPKQRILEVYVNVAEFGDGIYGAQAAARSYWNKDAAALTAGESARLAAVLPNPRRYSAHRPGPYVQKRARWIERNMRNLGGEASLQQLD